MNPLHPSTVIIWRIRGIVGALVLGLTIGALELFLLAPEGLVTTPDGLLTGAATALTLVFALLWPPLRYAHWRWSVGPDRVVIRRGVVWRTHSLLPRVRIQHVDTRNSPLQRWLGLSSLIIYTAGTRGADVEIPGLAAEQAERLREQLAELEELDERA